MVNWTQLWSPQKDTIYLACQSWSTLISTLSKHLGNHSSVQMYLLRSLPRLLDSARHLYCSESSRGQPKTMIHMKVFLETTSLGMEIWVRAREETNKSLKRSFDSISQVYPKIVNSHLQFELFMGSGKKHGLTLEPSWPQNYHNLPASTTQC